MAGQATGTVVTAVINGITERALGTVMRKLRSGSRPAATHEKLQRLETLVLKLRCMVEVSEKHEHAIGSTSLLEWRESLRKAAEEGGAVVLDFQRRAKEEEDGEAASTSAPSQQQSDAGALYFTRSALSGMAQRVRDATRRLFSTDEDMKKQDSMLEKMEELSPDITQFLMALQFEVWGWPVRGWPDLGQRPAKKRKATPARREKRKVIPAECQQRKVSKTKGTYVLEEEPPSPTRSLSVPVKSSGSGRVTLWDSVQKPSEVEATSENTQLASAVWDSVQKPSEVEATSENTQLASAAEDPESEARILASKLEPTLRRMDGDIRWAMDGTDMEGLEWLAEWAALLREAVERGNAVLQTLSSGSDAIHKQAVGGALEQDGELYSFARAVEQLALEEPCFATLLDIRSKYSKIDLGV